ncbi:glycosyltransferase family 4 protein [Methylocystis bryophila]|uniref:Glycosyl transferase family 1 n=1 Tax=Methylocystis bryophila TaxID=655015 RepID=A0A1W6MU06_9HYPH|nr:glycosyltransferase family 1 protein [Methylocystis bryophila]ARN81084.1 glycosyl transferase family 1 [Methylocystis bryophila]BDV37012.1 hypothetical protein DSM21852_02650 [Methylocystis bryophila]
MIPSQTDARGSAGGSTQPAPVIYDITRLVTRALNPSPNGIDRIDFTLARHLLSSPDERRGALIYTCLGHRLAGADAALRTIGGIEACWNEFIDPCDDAVYESVVGALLGANPRRAAEGRVKRRFDAKLFAQNWRALRQWAFYPGASLAKVPQGAIYVNASQFLLDKPWFIHWLDQRKDVKPVFYVHDLLPIDFPEFFWPGEPERHLLRMRNICRYGAGAITGTEVVARRLRVFAAEKGRNDLPICTARPPVSQAFATFEAADLRLAKVSYFVVCGTIEPRKNHLMLLNVWRELATRGPVPKLVIVGKRGWLCDNALDLLDRSESLRPHIVEVGGLSTPGLRRLLAGACALLMPSFGEGFGIPVAEAMAAGIPVIASDIDVFREIGGDALDYLDPLDGLGWLEAIEAHAGLGSARQREAKPPFSQVQRSQKHEFLSEIDAFLEKVASRPADGKELKSSLQDC